LVLLFFCAALCGYNFLFMPVGVFRAGIRKGNLSYGSRKHIHVVCSMTTSVGFLQPTQKITA
jgi:hypothetical protein